MKRICQNLQHTLADQGPVALRDDAAALEHLESCEDCYATLEALGQLDAAFAELEPEDAPDDLVAALLARPELDAPPESAASRPGGWTAVLPSWGRGFFDLRPPTRPLATAALLALGVFAVSLIWPQLAEQRQGRSSSVSEGTLSYVRVHPEGLESRPASDANEIPKPISEPRAQQLKQMGDRELQKKILKLEERDEIEEQERFFDRLSEPEPENVALAPPARVLQEQVAAIEKDSIEKDSIEVDGDEADGQSRWVSMAVPIVVNRDLTNLEHELPRGRVDRRERIAGDDRAAEEELGRRSNRPVEGAATEDELKALGYIGVETSLDAADPSSDETAVLAARRFLEARRRTHELTFETPSGYWQNTYLPGDRTLQQLQTRVERGLGDGLPRLHDAARRPASPFDPPSDAALTLYLSADRAAVQGPARLLVQVGLQASERHSARRPAMSLALVLDLRGEIATRDAAAMRALVEALAASGQGGDRFRLIVAGRPGAIAVEPDAFRHGPLSVALQKLLGSPEPLLAETWDLPQALEKAFETLAESDEPNAPLGSSMVLLVTSQPIGSDLARARELAHLGSVAGLPMSVVGVGGRVDLDQLDALALAGEGHRRRFTEPAEAGEVIDRELAALGRVVARAVRLRLRLAPGVELVEVVGSRKLDAPSAEEVREAERSLDQRLARDLGLTMDRGDDEDGIQIVIPAFHAGDHHVVLLDVVVPGPGAVLDARARYKDLVAFGNGTSSAQLTLPAGTAARGPLQRHVLKNLLAHATRAALRRASDALVASRDAEALAVLEGRRTLLRGLQLTVSGFEHDPDLAADLALIERFETAIGTLADAPDRRAHLVDSLRYAAELKLRPPPSPPPSPPPGG